MHKKTCARTRGSVQWKTGLTSRSTVLALRKEALDPRQGFMGVSDMGGGYGRLRKAGAQHRDPVERRLGAAGLRHLRGCELGAEKDAGLVYRDHPLPTLQPVRVADRTAGYPGVVDQDIEPD